MTTLRLLLLAAALCMADGAMAQGNGSGAGEGGGDKSGGGTGACANGLSLFDGERLVWTRDSTTFIEAVNTEPVGAGHRPEQPALALASLIEGTDDSRYIEVVTCGGRAQQYSAGQLRSNGRGIYVVANRRGAFKLVEIMPDGREQTLSRNVGRVTITKR